MGRTATTGVDSLDLDQHDGDCGSRDRHRGVQNDAQRAMIRVGVDRVDVRHLDDGKQGQQRQAHQHDHRVGSGLAWRSLRIHV